MSQQIIIMEVLFMKARKTFRKILSVLTAVVISACTMVCSASAAESNKYVDPGTAKPNYTIGTENGLETIKDTYSLSKVPSGSPSSGSYSVKNSNDITIFGFHETKSVFEINCTKFQETTSATAPNKPRVNYWTYVTKTKKDRVEDIIPGGFPSHYYTAANSSYIKISLLDMLQPENALQVKFRMENYSNSSTVFISGNYKLY